MLKRFTLIIFIIAGYQRKFVYDENISIHGANFLSPSTYLNVDEVFCIFNSIEVGIEDGVLRAKADGPLASRAKDL